MWQNDIIFATVVTDALMWPGTFFGLTHGTCRVVELSHLGVCTVAQWQTKSIESLIVIALILERERERERERDYLNEIVYFV